MHAALSKQPFGRTLQTSAKAATVDLLCWLLNQDSPISVPPVRDWLAAPSWDTLHPLTGRHIIVSAQEHEENATATSNVAARP